MPQSLAKDAKRIWGTVLLSLDIRESARISVNQISGICGYDPNAPNQAAGFG